MMTEGKLSTAALRRLKKQRQKGKDTFVIFLTRLERAKEEIDTRPHPDNVTPSKDVEIEYVTAPITTDESLYQDFASVIARFTLPVDNDEEEGQQQTHGQGLTESENEDSMNEDGGQADDSTLSKKKLKRLNRITLAELKQYAKHPEVVEWEDVTAKDPQLLVQLKAVRHSVPVPRHWSQKRKYLSGKRGYVKPPFELPAFIRETGITELRETMRAKDANKAIKVKAREKMHPKLGRISVDYERLYDAFFKYQTKPPLTMHGDVYYEGKEFEGKRDKKPGFLSEELRQALGMTTHLMPPPWLHNMQKYGPPPSYPHMKIPGLNATIPDGAQWGYHPGGWGKPPVENFMRDLPVKTEDPVQLMLLNPIERNMWGELEPDEELPEDETAAATEVEHGVQEMVLDEEQVEQYAPPTTVTEYREELNLADIPEAPDVIQVRKDRRRK
jgi:splicing factor 3B subunit 2